jgi:hypothetical protein
MKHITHHNYRIRAVASGSTSEGKLGKMYLIQEQPCGVITHRWFKKLDPPESYEGEWSVKNHTRVPKYNGHYMDTTALNMIHTRIAEAEEMLVVIIASREQEILKEVTTKAS